MTSRIGSAEIATPALATTRKRLSKMESLPPSLQDYILSYLDSNSLPNLTCLSKKMKEAAIRAVIMSQRALNQSRISKLMHTSYPIPSNCNTLAQVIDRSLLLFKKTSPVKKSLMKIWQIPFPRQFASLLELKKYTSGMKRQIIEKGKKIFSKELQLNLSFFSSTKDFHEKIRWLLKKHINYRCFSDYMKRLFKLMVIEGVIAEVRRNPDLLVKRNLILADICKVLLSNNVKRAFEVAQMIENKEEKDPIFVDIAQVFIKKNLDNAVKVIGKISNDSKRNDLCAEVVKVSMKNNNIHKVVEMAKIGLHPPQIREALIEHLFKIGGIHSILYTGSLDEALKDLNLNYFPKPLDFKRPISKKPQIIMDRSLQSVLEAENFLAGGVNNERGKSVLIMKTVWPME